MSEYGDSRIIQPTKKDFMNIFENNGRNLITDVKMWRRILYGRKGT